MITQNKLNPLYPVELITNGKSHFYKLGDGDLWFPGVTTVLQMIAKPALIQWSSNMACENIKEYLMENALNKPLTKEEIEKACLEGKNIYKKKAEAQADIGTKVHKAIDSLIKGDILEITDEIKPAIEGFINWNDSNDLTIEFGDTKIGSKVFGYGGSLDMVAFNKSNEAILVDFKTT